MRGHRGEAVELTAILWAAPEGGFSALNPETLVKASEGLVTDLKRD